MTPKYNFPEDLEVFKASILDALYPLRPADKSTKVERDFLFSAKRTNAGRSLPQYYLCYFLLVDLLNFKNLGQFEKVAWSVLLDFNGTAYLIEHRKMGLGVFAKDPDTQEEEAQEIVKKISAAVKLAKPYFEWKASEAAKESKLNVVNHHHRLSDRLHYFINEYKNVRTEADERAEEVIEEKKGNSTYYYFPAHELRQNAEWLALSAVDAFFSWTEHVFIHIAILNGKVVTGEDVANLADNEWANKFKAALDLESKDTKAFYDQLVTVKRQLRNYMTHGAFGKKGEAFSFHSSAGAVPLLLPHQKGNNRFSFYGDLGFDEKEVIDLIENFITHLWSEEREPARIYIESALPLILPMAKDGQYQSAMESVEGMEQLVEGLSWQFDQAANMDW